jgi:acyl-CoA reductase-like NAD-dependent aldehyde dehydrogenase
MATQTAIVHSSIVDKFTALLSANYPKASSTAGQPGDDAALRGLFTEQSAKRVDEAIKDAVEKGAEIVAGEHRVEGNVVQPVLLKGVTDKMGASFSLFLRRYLPVSSFHRFLQELFADSLPSLGTSRDLPF